MYLFLSTFFIFRAVYFNKHTIILTAHVSFLSYFKPKTKRLYMPI